MSKSENAQRKSGGVASAAVGYRLSAAAAVVTATVVVAVASYENDNQKNDPSTAVVAKCVTHNMCLLI